MMILCYDENRNQMPLMIRHITPADIARKVPKGTADVYVRVDENKLYYVLKNGETEDLDIWERRIF